MTDLGEFTFSLDPSCSTFRVLKTMLLRKFVRKADLKRQAIYASLDLISDSLQSVDFKSTISVPDRENASTRYIKFLFKFGMNFAIFGSTSDFMSMIV